MRNLTAADLQARLAAGPVNLLDVRSDEERALAHLAGSTHIPMHEIEHRLDELNPQAEIVVLCHHGMRSERVARFLEKQGFSAVSHLVGGLDAWAETIDPSMPRY